MNKEAIDKALESAYAMIERSSSSHTQWALNYFGIQRKRLAEDIAICLRYSNENSTILDIGSAPYYTTLGLKLIGRNITGTDIAPERFAGLLEESGLKVDKCNFETEALPYKDNSFDLILFAEVFEHLRIDLIKTMSEFRRVLKPGGVLLLSTPNMLEFTKFIRLLLLRETSDVYEEYEKLQTIGHMGHVREYTARDVKKFAIKCGFHHERTLYRGMLKLGLNPFKILRRFVQLLIPSSRKWFMLVLRKEG